MIKSFKCKIEDRCAICEWKGFPFWYDYGFYLEWICPKCMTTWTTKL